MLRRAVLSIVVVTTMTAVSGSVPAFAAGRPQAPVVTGMDMVQAAFPWASCGVVVSATFENIPAHGRYWVWFGVHSLTLGTTFTGSDGLSPDRTSASFSLGGDCALANTWDYGEVTLFRGGHAIASDVIWKTVSCPAIGA